MSQEERYGTRDLTYNVFHRTQSMRRFTNFDRARICSMIDLDGSLFIEYEDGTKEPLALIEIAQNTGWQENKPTTVTKKLALRAHLPAYLVLYTHAPYPNRAYPAYKDIEKFRVRQLAPYADPRFTDLSPQAWCDFVMNLRQHVLAPMDKNYRKGLHTRQKNFLTMTPCRSCGAEIPIQRYAFCARCQTTTEAEITGTALEQLHTSWLHVAPSDRLRFLSEILTPTERKAIITGIISDEETTHD